MKKLLVIIFFSLLIFTGCTSKQEQSNKEDSKNKETGEAGETEHDDTGLKIIKDKVFIGQTNDMALNGEDYEGQKFQIEGVIYIEEYLTEGHLKDFIVRKTPGCCGNDGYAGLPIIYAGEIPKKDTWVKGKGIWRKHDDKLWGWVLELYYLEETTPGDIFLDYNY